MVSWSKEEAETAMNLPIGTGQRNRLGNRRSAETFQIEHCGLYFTCTIGRYPSGRLAECFIVNHKTSSSADVNARDAGILVSLCLQYGCSAETIARALSRNTDGSASGVIGAVLDRISAMERGRP
jgi:hypothetical protein